MPDIFHFVQSRVSHRAIWHRPVCASSLMRKAEPGTALAPAVTDHGRGSWRRCLAVIAAAGATVAVTACGSTAKAGGPAGVEKRDLVIGAVPAVGSAGVYIAQERGLFARQGLHVTIKPITDPVTAIPALLHGSMDAVFGQWTSYIAAAAAGVPLHAIANGQALGPHSHEILVLPHSGITSPAQLKGKTIGVQALSGLDVMLVSSLLAEYGIRPSQVHFVVVPFPEMGAALAAHRVDAVEPAEPFVTLLEAKLGAEGLADMNEGPVQALPVAGYAVTDQWLARYPKTAAALARALDEAQKIASTNRPAVQRAVVADTHVTPEIAAVMALGIFPPAVDTAQLQRVADLMYRDGQLKNPFNVTKLTS
jgi:NitT/TauT family transport system substrate-binding protein